jgi:hypothetical protein
VVRWCRTSGRWTVDAPEVWVGFRGAEQHHPTTNHTNAGRGETDLPNKESDKLS